MAAAKHPRISPARQRRTRRADTRRRRRVPLHLQRAQLHHSPLAVGTISNTVIVRQVESQGDLRPSSDLLLALSLMVETIYLGLMATFFGMIFAIPLSFIAARNLMSENRITLAIYYVTRTMLNVVRSIEPLIWAIIAAAWVGPRPLRRDNRADAALDCLAGQALFGSD